MLSLHLQSIPVDFYTHKNNTEMKRVQKILGKWKNNYYFSIRDPSVLGQWAIICFTTVPSKAGTTVHRGGADPAHSEILTFGFWMGWKVHGYSELNSFMATFSKAKLFLMCLSGWMKTDASFLCIQSQLAGNSGLEVAHSCFLLLGNTMTKVINTAGKKIARYIGVGTALH